MKDWNCQPKRNRLVGVPDELLPLLNKIVMQMRFHTISDKGERLTAIHILKINQEYFSKHPHLLIDEKEELRLCYVEGNKAFFTTKAVTEQWGGDWDDRPYHCNAGLPYDSKEIRFDAPEFGVPHRTMQLSVREINHKFAPWLSDGETEIWAGTSLDKFIMAIKTKGGTVYSESE